MIREEMSLSSVAEKEALKEGLLDDAVRRLKAFVGTLPPEENNELQDVLTTIAQLDPQSAHDVIKTASRTTVAAVPRPQQSPGVKYTESIEENEK